MSGNGLWGDARQDEPHDPEATLASQVETSPSGEVHQGSRPGADETAIAKGKNMNKTQARRYYGTCAECNDPAEYGEVDGVKLCVACAGHHGLTRA